MIEQATHDPARSLRDRLHRIPPRIVARIDAERRRRGLAPLRDHERPDERFEDPGRPSVWVDARSRLAPPGPPPRGGLWPASAIPRTATRAILVLAGGEAPSWATGRPRGERLAYGALGTAEELNRSVGWLLRTGHDPAKGPILAMAGPTLKAHDTAVGLVAEWVVDLERADHRDALRLIEQEKWGVSLSYLSSRRTVVNGGELVMRGVLVHVALVARAAFPASLARVFRGRPDTADERRRQIDETVAAALRVIAGRG